MTWDHRYRRLDEGEIIRADDEVQNDDGSWRKGCLAAGQPAPDPNYTSHRVYRRLTPTTPPALDQRTLEEAAKAALSILAPTKAEWEAQKRAATAIRALGEKP